MSKEGIAGFPPVKMQHGLPAGEKIRLEKQERRERREEGA